MPECATVMYPEGDRPDRRFEQIIGKSAALESVLEQVERVASTGSTVLIEGEAGTGKELIAHAIHNASQRYGLVESKTLAKQYEALSRLSISLASLTPEELSRNLATLLRPLLDFDFLDVIVFKQGTSEVLWHSVGAGQ